MNNIKAVIFDLSEVYLQGLKGTEYKLSSILGIEHTIINSNFFTEKLNFLFHGKISENEYLFDLIQNNNWDIDIGTLKSVIRNNFIEIQGTREIIELLKRKGYKLGLLSVHAKEWIEYCNTKYNYHCLFDHIVYSFDVGISKPSKKSFFHMLNLLNESPKNILFIDDSIKNIKSSVKLGMNGILFKGSKELINELKKMKIL